MQGDAVAALSCCTRWWRRRGSYFFKFEFDLSWYGATMVQNMPLGWPEDVQPRRGGDGVAVVINVDFAGLN